ncbi:MAG: TlpA family protein disulfide reductase [Desulfobacula sp.]|jgi:thiol-disulfide isomerase/thioredoxin|uniref:TlpA family protein disulfide reductase n=1 Tax=Desulfobacula sp. TaxID=2593537 RepID=UPI001D54B4BD|nr:TlpA family protein disulfide reductase [Desulfobacula sp.]MBT3484346.1 TlpA family protein disulfide reductase [Desulfobacula sp.]MBT3806195.1 TlpA family protein disulfide reductase [Desulfobacula sp.]MBT4024155.1 TlpA family protein disulfide reductase [Desulfobacula sp.]MBT4197479.1 TlpA family protein disulfide reductase [Desulfobacula sp.]
MENSKPVNIYSFIPVLCLAIVLFSPLFPFIGKAYSKDATLDKKFASIGIIKLAGFLPPASHDPVDMDGIAVKLSDLKGKIVFINFWTTWCPDCVDEMPDIENLHKKLNNNDFIILGIDLKESKKKVKKFIKKHNLTFKIVLDKKGDMGRAFGIRSIPTTFILNRKGGLIGKAMGARNWDNKQSIDLFEYLLENY